jgi:hypothetical protein
MRDGEGHFDASTINQSKDATCPCEFYSGEVTN